MLECVPCRGSLDAAGRGRRDLAGRVREAAGRELTSSCCAPGTGSVAISKMFVQINVWLPTLVNSRKFLTSLCAPQVKEILPREVEEGKTDG